MDSIPCSHDDEDHGLMAQVKYRTAHAIDYFWELHDYRREREGMRECSDTEGLSIPFARLTLNLNSYKPGA